MSTGTGIFLIAAGAVLRFALAAGSSHGLNVHVVGVILILAGVVGLMLPRLTRPPQDQLTGPPQDRLTPPPKDRLRRWVRPGQLRIHDEAPTGEDPGSDDDRPALVQNASGCHNAEIAGQLDVQ